MVVSGRSREDVAQRVDLPELAYAGSHGFDIEGPSAGAAGGGASLRYQAAREAEPLIAAATRALEAELAGVPGAQVESKRFTVAVHYRRVAPERVGEVEAVVDRQVAARPGLRKAGGKKVWEIRPDLDWDKGRAVLWMLAALGLDRPEVVPVYLGDDLTDEDAFRALGEREVPRSPGGIGILVADEPRATAARFVLRDPAEVRRFLADFAEEPA